MVDTFGDEDGEMTAEGTLKGRGDVVPGTFDTQTKIFTASAVVSS
jgi:hypothetical protein